MATFCIFYLLRAIKCKIYMKIYGTFLDVMEAVFTFISRNLYVIEVILLSKEVIKGRLITVDWAYEVSVQM